MPRIGRFLDLELFELPDFTTVCMRMQELKMPIWRRLLRLSAGRTTPADPGDRRNRHGSRRGEHYAKRTNYTFRAVKTTALIDCETGLILDIHCSMK